MPLGERLRQLREKLGLRQSDLADQIGVSRVAVTKWESGDREPDFDTVKRIASLFDVTTDFLLGKSNIPNPEKLPGYIPAGPTRLVPVLGAIHAGAPVLAEQFIEGYEEVPIKDLNGGEYFYLRVTGSSMEPTIRPGYLVLVRRQPCAEDGDVVVAMVNDDDEATLKKFYARGDIIYLQAENPAYQPIIVPADKVRIIGVVTQFVGKLKKA